MKLDVREWEIEIAYFIEKKGIAPDTARMFVIYRWMWHGDLRPLAAEIDAGRTLDREVLDLLATMILDDINTGQPFRIITQARKRGRPRDPTKAARDIISTLGYDVLDGKSEKKFEELAEIIGRSPKSVRAAVTRRRKAK
jgi:hypothetical protein